MKKNLLLKTALYMGYFLCIILLLGLLVFTGLFIRSRIDPVSKGIIREVKLSQGVWTYTFAPTKDVKRRGNYIFFGPDEEARKTGFWYTYRYNSEAITKIDNKPVIEKLRPFSHYLIYFRLLLLFIISIMVTLEFVKIIKSVKNLQSFQETNVSSLQKIGKYLLWIFLISGLKMAYFKYYHFYEFTIDFGLLAAICLILVLAEVFKEGNRLQKENQLTV